MLTVDRSVLEQLAQSDSATVQNAGILVRGYIPAKHDYTGPELNCMLPSFGTLVGYAMTAELMPLNADTVEEDLRIDYYDSIARAGVPTIAVLKDVDEPAGRGAIIGDGMCYQLRALGCIGVVADGSARDVPGIRRAGVGLWATSRVPGHGPFKTVRHGGPVKVAGLKINQGDILVCDADGVTRVPVDMAAEVARKVEEVRQTEAALHRYFRQPGFNLDSWDKWKDAQG